MMKKEGSLPLRNFSLIITAIFRQRDLGNLIESRKSFMDLVVEFSYPLYGSIDDKWKSLRSFLDRESAQEFILLDISFLRSHLKFDEAIKLGESTQAYLVENHIRENSRLSFELGVTLGAHGNYQKAFDHFVKVPFNPSHSSNRDSFILAARLNLILCLEALGHDYKSYLLECEKIIDRELSSGEDELSIREQFYALKIRESFFRNSEIQSIVELDERSEDLRGQARYLYFFICDLPWTNIEHQSQISMERELVEKGKYWLNSYRVATFKELLISEDLNANIRLEAHIERLYLWMWKWMIEPTVDRLNRVDELLQFLLRTRFDQEVTEYHSQMLENTCKWRSFFRGSLIGSGECEGINLRYSKSYTCPHLSLESLFIDKLSAQRDGQITFHADTEEAIKQYETKVSNPFSRKAMKENEAMGKLCKSLDFEVMTPRYNSEQSIHVNIKSFQVISSLLKEGELNSFSISRFLYIFSCKEFARKEEVYKFSFDVKFYDDFEHGQKLSNLLSTINRHFSGKIRFTSKNANIYISNPGIEIIPFGCSEHSLMMLRPTEESLVMTTERASYLNKWIKRSEVELCLGISKSTANRRLESWLESGVVKKRGLGKKTMYHFFKDPQEIQ